MDAKAEIALMLDAWAASVRAHDLEGAVRGRSAEIVIFDVPAPLQAKGIDAYRETWRLYFRDPGSRRFALQETTSLSAATSPGSGPCCSAPPMPVRRAA